MNNCFHLVGHARGGRFLGTLAAWGHCTYTHKHTHTHIHTFAHSHIHTHTHTHTHTPTPTHPHTHKKHTTSTAHDKDKKTRLHIPHSPFFYQNGCYQCTTAKPDRDKVVDAMAVGRTIAGTEKVRALARDESKADDKKLILSEGGISSRIKGPFLDTIILHPYRSVPYEPFHCLLMNATQQRYIF
jgi:hypothetical protein